MKMLVIFKLFLVILCVGYSACNDELYDVLGVGRGASGKEIKQAYKRLAREWHPDKNKDPTATDKFTKINEAYETLSDPEKRANYDNYGFTSAQDRQPRHHQGRGFHPFDHFFSGGFGDPFGGFGGGEGNNMEKFLITLRNFESKLNPQSYHNPCFFYVYSDFCFSCMRIEPVISKFMTELESIGMCVGAIHVGRSRGLANHFHIHSAPAMIGLVSGRHYFYKNSAISFNHLRDFMRGLFPSHTVTTLHDGNFKHFLAGWKDNRVRAVFFGTKPEPSLRFLAPAFFHTERVAFGYVNTQASNVDTILKENNINKYRESLFVWNEDYDSPMASISMQQLSRSTVDEIVAANKFLSLPRLSSQKVFDELCPEQLRNRKQKRLCVALLTRRSSNHDLASTTFRDLAQTSKFSSELVRFAYIYEDVQQNFIKALAKGNETRSHVVVEVIIFWRVDSHRVQYEFLEQGWNLDPELAPQSRSVLEKRLTQILEGNNLLPYRAIIPEFYNEHMLGLFTRIVYKLADWIDRVYYFFVSYDGMTVLTAVAAIIFIGLMGWSMRKLAESEAEQMKKEKLSKQAQKRPPSCSSDNQTIHLYEIRSETFANLVSEADTGLTITVLVDETSKEKLLRIFAEIMQPYSRYSGLTFAFLQLEYYLEWYRHLLELSLDFKVSLDSINNRNCIGSVLAINGYRKYYYIYHPKRARKWMRKHHGSNVTKAVGFGESDSDDTDEGTSREESVLFVDELLSGLSLWLDRVFDGSVKKVRLPYWPEMR